MGTWPLWIAFNACVAFFLLLDQGFIHRRPETISLRAAAAESAAWIALSLGFGTWIYVARGRAPGLEFFAGYVVEKSLSEFHRQVQHRRRRGRLRLTGRRAPTLRNHRHASSGSNGRGCCG